MACPLERGISAFAIWHLLPTADCGQRTADCGSGRGVQTATENTFAYEFFKMFFALTSFTGQSSYEKFAVQTKLPLQRLPRSEGTTGYGAEGGVAACNGTRLGLHSILKCDYSSPGGNSSMFIKHA